MNKNPFTILGFLASIPLLILYSTLSYGFVLYKTYNWCIPIILPDRNYPILSLKGAIALNLVATLFTYRYKPDKYVGDQKITTKKSYVVVATALLIPWFLLLMTRLVIIFL